MKRVKGFFNKMSQREKVLLAGFLWVMVLIWLSLYFGRMSDLRSGLKEVGSTLDYQQIWIDGEDGIAERLVDALKALDPKKTYTKNRFIGKVDGIARGVGGNYNVSNPRTTEGDVFNEHGLTVQFRDATMGNLIAFDKAMDAEIPYMAVKRVKITPNRRDPNLLGAQFDIIAIELQELESLKEIEEDEKES